MKKLLIVLLAMVTFGAAQESSGLAFSKGTNAIGVGFNADYGSGIGVSVAWDLGAIHNMFSLGAEAGLTFDREDYGSSYYEQSWVNLSPQFRFGFHPFGLDVLQGKIKVADKLDPYVVAHTGPSFSFWSQEWKDGRADNDYSDMDFGWSFGIAMGVRWMFKPNFGLWGEVDWDRFIGGVAFQF